MLALTNFIYPIDVVLAIGTGALMKIYPLDLAPHNPLFLYSVQYAFYVCCKERLLWEGTVVSVIICEIKIRFRLQ